jgi:hypothetical protein
MLLVYPQVLIISQRKKCQEKKLEASAVMLDIPLAKLV